MQHADQSDLRNPPEHMHTAGYGAPRKRSKKGLLVGILIFVIVLAAAAGAYWFLTHKKSTPAKSQAATQQSSNQSVPDTQAVIPKTYKSAKLNIEFTYRSDWTMRETSDKSEIILTSPTVNYQTKSGASKQGVFTLKFRNGLVPDAMKSTIEGATASADSEVIAYAAPSDQQRQYTTLSFGGTADATNFVIVSGSVAFKTGELFGSNIDLQGAVYLFAGGYGSDPNDALTFDAVPKASFQSNVYKQAVAIIESLKIY